MASESPQTEMFDNLNVSPLSYLIPLHSVFAIKQQRSKQTLNKTDHSESKCDDNLI